MFPYSLVVYSLFSLFSVPTYEYTIICLFYSCWTFELLAVLNYVLGTFQYIYPVEHKQTFLWGLCLGMKQAVPYICLPDLLDMADYYPK